MLGLSELQPSLSDPVLSLQQCEQLVAELRGSVRQAVRLYHLVSVGHQPTSGNTECARLLMSRVVLIRLFFHHEYGVLKNIPGREHQSSSQAS